MHSFSTFLAEKNWLKAMKAERRLDRKIKGNNPLMGKGTLAALGVGSAYLAARGLAHAAAGDMIGAGLAGGALAGTLGSAAMMYKRHWPEVRKMKAHLDMMDRKKTLKESDDDYRGQHQAPDKEGGAPLHDVSSNGIYPKDYYDNPHWYGAGKNTIMKLIH